MPISGRPLGPGGYGSLDLLGKPGDLRYLVSATTETAAPREKMRWESVVESSSMRGIID